MKVTMSGRPSKPRLLLFAFGDFAFNLFWQSIMLFLLFYYTDALDLPIGIAATTYMAASVWDGIANFIAGILVDRGHARFRYGPFLIAGAVPLGLTFVLTYFPPVVSGGLGAAGVFAAPPLFPSPSSGVEWALLSLAAPDPAPPPGPALVARTRPPVRAAAPGALA